MIQINIPMPKNCYDCPFNENNAIHLCTIMPGIPAWKTVSAFDKERSPHCPLQEVPEKKKEHFVTDDDGVTRYYGKAVNDPTQFVSVCSVCNIRKDCPVENRKHVIVCPEEKIMKKYGIKMGA